jgi:hypothetical protein
MPSIVVYGFAYTAAFWPHLIGAKSACVVDVRRGGFLQMTNHLEGRMGWGVRGSGTQLSAVCSVPGFAIVWEAGDRGAGDVGCSAVQKKNTSCAHEPGLGTSTASLCG